MTAPTLLEIQTMLKVWKETGYQPMHSSHSRYLLSLPQNRRDSWFYPRIGGFMISQLERHQEEVEVTISRPYWDSGNFECCIPIVDLWLARTLSAALIVVDLKMPDIALLKRPQKVKTISFLRSFKGIAANDLDPK